MASDSTRWMEMALDCEKAADMLFEADNWRSSVSRSYYAAYCAIHAMLIHRGETPPPRGNWPHKGLGDVLHTTLSQRKPNVEPRVSKDYRIKLNRLYHMRAVVDYDPKCSVDEDDAAKARKFAGPFLRHAERMLES